VVAKELRSKEFNSISIWSCHDARPLGRASATRWELPRHRGPWRSAVMCSAVSSLFTAIPMPSPIPSKFQSQSQLHLRALVAAGVVATRLGFGFIRFHRPLNEASTHPCYRMFTLCVMLIQRQHYFFKDASNNPATRRKFGGQSI
jgi:hypothetical protein